MTYGRIKSASYEAVYDRSYRLRKNRTQVNADQGYILGGVIGLVASSVTKANPVVGSLVGMTTGLVGVGVYNNMLKSEK